MADIIFTATEKGSSFLANERSSNFETQSQDILFKSTTTRKRHFLGLREKTVFSSINRNYVFEAGGETDG